MSRVIVLDAGPLGLATNPRTSPASDGCRRWIQDVLMAGSQIVVPEIVDYEVRRALIRANRSRGLGRLDQFLANVRYLPITTLAMRKAAELWAHARQIGQPTASDNTIDADMILIAQAMSLNEPQATIATSNIGHLGRFFAADIWTNITS